MSLNLYEVLCKDERVLILSSEEDRLIITWNQFSTLQKWKCFQRKPLSKDGETHLWEEIGILVTEDTMTFEQARSRAKEWLYE